ncbi:MAG: hypothetical protein Q8K82_12575 [Gemmatimonadaceae bacterium]|nr:hypothetical protein [Gemmatimonadaceae bacterium]
MRRPIELERFYIAHKTRGELEELREQFQPRYARARLAFLRCWLRNRIANIAYLAVMFGVGSLGFVVLAGGPIPDTWLEWIVGIGWFVGSAHFLGKRDWINDLSVRWAGEEDEWRYEFQLNREWLTHIRIFLALLHS